MLLMATLAISLNIFDMFDIISNCCFCSSSMDWRQSISFAFFASSSLSLALSPLVA